MLTVGNAISKQVAFLNSRKPAPRHDAELTPAQGAALAKEQAEVDAAKSHKKP
jgi:hypothetical protein